MTRVDLARLSDVSTGIPNGTSFPGSPADGDLFYRSDRDILYRYRSSGTRWVSVTLYRENLTRHDDIGPKSTNGTIQRGPAWNGDYDLWLENFYTYSYVGTTNNGTNFWTITLEDTAGNVIATTVTSADANDVYAKHKTAIGALLGTSRVGFQIFVTKTLSPGAIYAAGSFTYRLVG